jgi:hypothetical protein
VRVRQVHGPAWKQDLQVDWSPACANGLAAGSSVGSPRRERPGGAGLGVRDGREQGRQPRHRHRTSRVIIRRASRSRCQLFDVARPSFDGVARNSGSLVRAVGTGQCQVPHDLAAREGSVSPDLNNVATTHFVEKWIASFGGVGDQDVAVLYQRSSVSGVTTRATAISVFRPKALARTANLRCCMSVSRRCRPPSCSRRTRFSSRRNSMTCCWPRLTHPTRAKTQSWKTKLPTGGRVVQSPMQWAAQGHPAGI